MSAELDHLVLGCLSLADARPEMEARLGVRAQGGGAHEGRGTRNALWGLETADGPAYLELIGPDPDQPRPEGALPFGLHLEAVRERLLAGPRLIAWVARCRDLDERLARSPVPLGAPRGMRRGALTWRLTVAEGGRTPLEGVIPALIEWPDEAVMPARTLAGSGLRLADFVRRPDAEAGRALAALGLDHLLPEGETHGQPLRARLDAPAGRVVLD
jgi:hypothetical protein